MRKRLVKYVLAVIGMASAFVSPTALASAEMPLTFSDSGYMTTRWVDLAISSDGMIVYAAQNSMSGSLDKIWKSTNGGAADISNTPSWSELTSSPSGRWIAIDASADGQIVYAVWTNAVVWTLYKSVDGGVTWLADAGFTNHTQICDVTTDDTGDLVFVSTCDQNIYGAEGGTSWTQFTVADNVRRVDVSGDGQKLVGIAPQSAFISTSPYSSWNTRNVVSNSGLSSVTVSYDGSTILIGSMQGSDADAWVSTDGGLDFDPAGFSAEYGSSSQGTYSSMSGDGSTMLWAWYGGPIKFSRDGGDSWYTPTETPLRGWLSFAINADGTRGVLSVEGGGGSWNFRRSTPSLNSATPAQGASAFPNRVTLTGTNFYEGCVASIDGVAQVTTFVSSTILRVAIGASGPSSGEFTVECDGLNSNAVDWVYTQQTTTTTTTVATTTGSTLPPTGARGNLSSYWALALLVLGLGLAGFRARSRS